MFGARDCQHAPCAPLLIMKTPSIFIADEVSKLGDNDSLAPKRVSNSPVRSCSSHPNRLPVATPKSVHPCARCDLAHPYVNAGSRATAGGACAFPSTTTVDPSTGHCTVTRRDGAA